MARAFNSLQANTLAALVTAINAYLAPFIAGAAVRVLRIDIRYIQMERYLGHEFIAFITTDTAGAAAQTAPFVLATFDAGNDTDLETAIAAYLLANAANFVSGVHNMSDAEVSNTKRVTGWAVSCTDAVNGPTNWLDI